jgi:hypothetical protein
MKETEVLREDGVRIALQRRCARLLRAELVVEEDALSCLRAKVALKEARRADGRREHEVELVRLGQVVARLRRLDTVLAQLRSCGAPSRRQTAGAIIAVANRRQRIARQGMRAGHRPSSSREKESAAVRSLVYCVRSASEMVGTCYRRVFPHERPPFDSMGKCNESNTPRREEIRQERKRSMP